MFIKYPVLAFNVTFHLFFNIPFSILDIFSLICGILDKYFAASSTFKSVIIYPYPPVNNALPVLPNAILG